MSTPEDRFREAAKSGRKMWPLGVELFNKPTPDELAEKNLNHKERMAALVILILSLISGVWTFEGAYLQNQRVGGDSFYTVVYSALIAVGVTAAQVTAWWVLIAVIPSLKPGRWLLLGMALTGALQLWTFAVSSTNNGVALTGGPALIRELQDQRSKYAEAIEQASARALAIKPYLGILEGEAEGRCAQLASEVERGGVTGSAGRGAVSGTLELLCAQSRRNAALMRSVVEANEARTIEAQQILSSMDRVIFDDSMTVFERETAFLQLAGQAEAWLLQTRSDDMSQVLRTSHKAMAASVSTLPTEAGSFGNRQTAVIEGLKASIGETGQLYSKVADDLERLPPGETPRAERVSIVFAVWRSAWHHLPSMAAALGIDLFQLFMVLAFILARGATPSKKGSSSRSRTSKPKLSLKEKETGS